MRPAPVDLLRIAGLLLTSCAAGCWFDPAIQGEQFLSCRDHSDCPEGYYCQGYLERCVAETDRDEDAPFLVAAVSPSPAVGGYHSTFELRFEVNEALAEPPEVTIDLGDRRASFILVLQEGQSFLYRYPVRGSEPESVAPVTVSLIDRGGKQASGLAAGTVTFDFTAPALTNHPLPVPEVARAGAEVALDLQLDEEPAAPPQVWMDHTGTGEEQLWPDSLATSGKRYAYRFVPGNAMSEGSYILHTRATDAVGNSEGDLDLGELVLDFTAPELIEVQVGQRLLRPGEVTQIVFEASEPVTDPPLFTAVSIATSFNILLQQATATTLGYRYQAVAEHEGQFELTLGPLCDRAGNCHTTTSHGQLVIDATPPGIVNFGTSAPAPGVRPLSGNDTLEIWFDASEELASAPRVWLETLEFTPVATEGSEQHRFSLDLAGSGFNGFYPILMELFDHAGHSSLINAATVRVDAVPPGLIDAAFSPAIAGLDRTARFTVTVDERLGAVPKITWASARNPGFELVEHSGFSFTFEISVDAVTEPGLYRVEALELVDLAGNLALAQPQTPDFLVDFTVDNQVPGLTLTANRTPTRYSAVEGFNQVVYTVLVTEPIAPPNAAVQARIGEREMTCLPEEDPVVWSCSVTVAAEGEGLLPEGALPVLVTARDAAGNIGFGSSSVEIDLSPPLLVSGSASLRLIPPPGCLMEQVTALGVGAQAELLFALNEPVSADPVVRAVATTTTLDFERQEGSSAFFTHRTTLERIDVDQGTYGLTIDAQDDLGNRVEHALEQELTIDTRAPLPPRGSELYLMRSPFGSEETGGNRRFHVASYAEGAVEENVSVLIWESPDLAQASRIGQGVADGDGGVAPIELVRIDLPVVYLSQVDAACNLDSALATRVENGRYVVTLGFKNQAGFGNPHSYYRTGWLPTALGNLWEGQELDPEPLVREGGSSARIQGAGRWLRLNQNLQDQGPRYAHASALDLARGRLVLFGGQSGYQLNSDTWEWDGRSWTQLAGFDPEGDGRPVARRDHAMAFDSSHGVVVLFGGNTSATSTLDSDETWAWNGGSWHNRTAEAKAAGDYPGARHSHAVAYDATRRQLVMFGGTHNYSGANQETWVWDGEGWLERTPDPLPDPYPGARSGHRMAYDTSRQRIVMYGGGDDERVWEWNGGSWNATAPVTGPTPGPQSAHTMAYDPVSKRVALWTSGGTLYFWDGATWEQASPALDVVPAAREASTLVSWAEEPGLVLVGGRNDLGDGNPITWLELDDSWRWDGTAWLQEGPADPEGDGRPPRLGRTALAYHEARREVILYGGHAAGGPSHDFWIWNGHRWKDFTPDLPPGFPYPCLLYGQAVTYDQGASLVVMHGGQAETRDCPGGHGPPPATWLCDGLYWNPYEHAAPSMASHAIAFDPYFGWTTLFGGDQTWRFTYPQPGWQRVYPSASPGSRWGHAMVYSPSDNAIVLFGGSVVMVGDSAETWGLRGIEWSDLSPADPADSPAARAQHCMAYDRSRQRVVLFGGATEEGRSNELWEWDGSRWLLQAVADPELDLSPAPRDLCSMVYETARDRILIYGGDADYGRNDEMWAWQSGVVARPGQALRVEIEALILPPGAEMSGLRARALAGGDSEDEAGQVSGAELLLWRAGGWRSLATNRAAVDTPQELTWTTSSSESIRQALFAGTINLALAPVGRNGQGRAEVAVDYIEVRLDYRLPSD